MSRSTPETKRSVDTQSHSQVSGLDLEIDSIIGRSHHHPPPTQETFWREITLISPRERNHNHTGKITDTFKKDIDKPE